MAVKFLSSLTNSILDDGKSILFSRDHSGLPRFPLPPPKHLHWPWAEEGILSLCMHDAQSPFFPTEHCAREKERASSSEETPPPTLSLTREQWNGGWGGSLPGQSECRGRQLPDSVMLGLLSERKDASIIIIPILQTGERRLPCRRCLVEIRSQPGTF